MSTPPPEHHYGIVVPVKPPSVAKSRLVGIGDALRRELVVAFAVDTINAAMAAPIVDVVLAVTDDHELALELSGLGAYVIPDGTADDLNASLAEAAAEVHRRWPGLWIGALCGDLPALRPDELSLVLAEVPEERALFVADTQAVGTTLLAAPSPELFIPHFGAGSHRAHLDAGAMEFELDDVPGLRRDVDTPADLTAAIKLGVGSRTSVLAAGLRL